LAGSVFKEVLSEAAEAFVGSWTAAGLAAEVAWDTSTSLKDETVVTVGTVVVVLSVAL
jgi:hypothetical protein